MQAEPTVCIEKPQCFEFFSDEIMQTQKRVTVQRSNASACSTLNVLP